MMPRREVLQLQCFGSCICIVCTAHLGYFAEAGTNVVTREKPKIPKAVLKAAISEIEETVGIRITAERGKELLNWKSSHPTASPDEVAEKECDLDTQYSDQINREKFVEVACGLTYSWWDLLQGPVYNNGNGILTF